MRGCIQRPPYAIFLGAGTRNRPGASGACVRDGRRKAGAGDSAKRSESLAVDYGALAEFRYQLRKFLAFSETAARKAGLTPQQYQALLAIKGFSTPEPVSVGDLARILLVRHHTAVERVDRMTKLGLLIRTVDQNDGRRVLVRLTAKGEQKLQTLARIHFEELRSASPAMTRILKSFQLSQSRQKQDHRQKYRTPT
jgi:DNA-binding MarR family transcriptional regulator